MTGLAEAVGVTHITDGAEVTDRADAERWALTLYINGASAGSIRAIEAVRRVCDDELGGHVELEVVDVHDHPALVLRDHIVATPTLVKRLPGPPRHIVGDLSDSARLRLWFGLEPADDGTRPGRDV